MSRMDIKSGQFTNYHYKENETNCLSNENVRAICPDTQTGFLWIGTWGGGLDRLDTRTGRFTNFPIDTVDISSNVILTILRDDNGFLWIGTY